MLYDYMSRCSHHLGIVTAQKSLPEDRQIRLAICGPRSPGEQS